MISVELKISFRDWLYIILIGALFGFLISLFFYFLSVELKEVQTIFFSVFTAVSVSLFAFFLINLSNNYILPHVDKKFWYLISFIFSFCSGSLGFTFSYLLFSVFDGISVIKIINPYWIYISITIGFLTFLIGLILHQFIPMKYKNESIKSDVLESKLKALENELNPHFLFNALNSVSELIYVDQKKAEKAVLDISSFLRNAIYKSSLITLENEISMLKTYVNIENIRFSDKIKLNINIDTKHFYIMMPKFSIQLLVENAIKHGYEGNDLIIDINFNEENYSIEVSNNGKVTSDIRFGTGLNNLAKRLNLQNIGTLSYEALGNKMMFIIKLYKDKKLKILIVDDENLAISRLTRLLNDLGYDDITSFENPIDAIKDISKNSYDVAFLDISMPSMTGLELADTILNLKNNIFIVFQTAYQEYALEAYKTGGLAYLLKPVDSDELQKVMLKVTEYGKSSIDSKKIVGKRGDKLYLINIDDIYYIKADLDEVIIKIKDTDVYVRRKIGDLETLLSGKNFFRVRRSYIVNVDKIKSMKSVEQSKLQISFEGISDIVTSSKDGAKEFREYIEKRSL